MSDTVITFNHVSKEYRLGAIGGGSLKSELQTWWARKKGKDDPYSVIVYKEKHHTNQRFLALDDISFEVKRGDALGIIGRNGAGKSTMLKLLSRVTAPTKGTISYIGRIASMLEVGTGFHGELTGRENVYLNGAILGMSKAEITKKFDEIITFAEMEQFIDTPVKRYSSGMYVKLAFAVAAHLDNEILVLDEVLAVGDMKFQQKCLGRMENIANKEGRTLLYVSHNMNTIKQLCNKCILLDQGKITYCGSTENAIDLYMQSNNDLAAYKSFIDYIRPWYLSNGGILISSCELLNSKNGEIQGEHVVFRITFSSKKEIENLRIRAEIRTTLDIPVCTALSTVLYKKTHKDSEYEDIFQINVNSLIPGRYSAVIVFYQCDDYGANTMLDSVPNAIEFVVPFGGLIMWEKSNFGYIQLPDIERLS